ncbi:hypothetical protein BDZ94DRAFT_1262142 [Collybia nuda]|uniref:Uncharacterized protein n=1 Tax=Collybia nuda TaxID=64659 RepID=A0A9P6CDM8_9AGAR|nr:hypothetical protein BDZ94DRAFT_1262142 [Collybia nuda]
MLHPPLSLLPDDLIAYIVEHVAKLPFQGGCLHNLSITDRAFTQFCQSYIFRTLSLSHDWRKGRTFKKLEKLAKILNTKPQFANQVRVVDLSISRSDNAWLFDDPSLLTILQMLAKSLVPPHEIRFGANTYTLLTIEDPILMVGRLTRSFFSQTLTTLHLTRCTNVPLPLFLICPGLKEVVLDRVGVTEITYETYPDKQCFGRKAPSLEIFDFRDSESLVNQMITPPSRFHTPVILWSKLRILTLSPHEEEEMDCLQLILDEACESLEELHLTNLHDTMGRSEQLPLACFVNLNNLTNLRVFALYAIIECNAEWSWVLDDINAVLRTIPTSNQIMDLSFDFTISSDYSFDECLGQDWAGLINEAIRVSAGEPLELELNIKVTGGIGYNNPRRAELFASIMEKTKLVAKYSNICTHFWNPTYWAHGLDPSLRGQMSGNSILVYYPPTLTTPPAPATCLRHSSPSIVQGQFHFS